VSRNQRELDACIAEDWALAHERSACEKCTDAPGSAESRAEEARAARVIATRIRNTKIKEPILVWRFEDAPPEYKVFSVNGGDQDWLARVPAHMQGQEDIGWLESPAFGAYDVEKFVLPDGGVLYIGSHS